MQGYKFLAYNMTSSHGDSGIWEIGEWKQSNRPLKLCRSGFHYCRRPIDAFNYFFDDSAKLCLVETEGEELHDADKTCARRMRVLKVIDAKKVAIQFAIACARHVLPTFEKKYPDDRRPRTAIDAAEAYLKDPSPEKSAASSAASSAAWSAASSAAWSAEQDWQNKTLVSIMEES